MEGAYSHRFKPDGSVDSICHRCFLTIGTVAREAELESVERKHVCNPEDKLRSEILAEESKLSD